MSKPRLQLILSPAKTMCFDPCAVADKAGTSEAVGLQRVDELASVMAKQSKAQLKDCLGVSDAIASENYERFQSWDTAEPRQAVVAYSGFACPRRRPSKRLQIVSRPRHRRCRRPTQTRNSTPAR